MNEHVWLLLILEQQKSRPQLLGRSFLLVPVTRMPPMTIFSDHLSTVDKG
jgi:hypothetical protein